MANCNTNLRFLFILAVFIIVCSLLSVSKREGHVTENLPIQNLSENIKYNVLQLRHAFSGDECDAVIKYMSDKVNRSTVIGTNGSEDVVSQVRTSSSGWIKRHETHPVEIQIFIKKMLEYGSKLSGLYDIDLFEDISIVKYQPSQYYKEHYDACTTLRKCGAGNRVYRVSTCLLYLNDEFDGGETAFPKAGLEVKPEAGKMIYFYNTHRDGTEIEESMHAGKPVVSGVKWIATLWIKFNPDKENINKLEVDSV